MNFRICLNTICSSLEKYGPDLLNQVPLHLEANILLKHFSKNGELLMNCKKGNNLDKISRPPTSRSEYCTIS